MKLKAVSGATLTLLLIGMLTLAFNTQLVDANPVYPGQVTMTREDIDATISPADPAVQASVNGTYTFHVFGAPHYPVTMYYPVPPDASNVSVKIDETPLAWDWNGTYYPTVLGDYPFIKWTIFTYPADFKIRTHYEHPVPFIDREYQFLYAMGTGRYLAEPKECEAYVKTYISKDVVPTESHIEVYLVTVEGTPEPATYEITSLDGVWNVSYNVNYWYWSKDFLITIKANPWTVDDDGPADFQTIQEAINAASPGDTIYVRNGTYHELVVVNKSVSLIGDEISKPSIIATGPPPPFINGSKATVRISANNVTIKGFEIQSSIDWVIFSNHSSNCVIDENTVKADFGICIVGGSGNKLSNNRVGSLNDCCIQGLVLEGSSNNVVTGNSLSPDCHDALRLYNSNHNYIAFNYISAHFTAQLLAIVKSNNNLIVGNTIEPVMGGGIIGFVESNGNVFYHNNIAKAESTDISIDEISMNNTWDNGYPSGGNYWSDYGGTDFYRGPCQNVTGSDGIGDTAYIINANNTDRYPLINPVPPFRDIAITNVLPSKTVIGQGFSLNVNVTIANRGTYTENFNVTACYDDNPIKTKTIINMPPSEEITLTFTWNTTVVPYGNYTIGAVAETVPDETATADNTLTDGWVLVTVPGDMDGDGECNILDVKWVKLAFSGWIDYRNADIDGDGAITILDLKLVKLIYSGLLT